VAYTGPPRLPAGVWGGGHAELDVRDSDAGFDGDCAHGTISGPIAVDADGTFGVTGTYTAEHGGPIGIDETGSVPAVYTGRVAGDSLTLTVSAAGAGEVGTFTVTRGQAGKIFKCE